MKIKKMISHATKGEGEEFGKFLKSIKDGDYELNIIKIIVVDKNYKKN